MEFSSKIADKTAPVLCEEAEFTASRLSSVQVVLASELEHRLCRHQTSTCTGIQDL